MAAGLLAGYGCSCPHIRLGLALSARPAGQLYRSSSSGAICPVAQELSPTAVPELHPQLSS
eukprot:6162491-Prymnesium_polylepis.1